MANDLEKGQEPQQQQQQQQQSEQDVIQDQAKRRRIFGIAFLVLIAIGLIVGLSVGLTRPNNNEASSSASLGNQDGTASEATTRVKFQSTGRAFNVTMDLLSPDVLEGYDNEDDLKADLGEAV